LDRAVCGREAGAPRLLAWGADEEEEVTLWRTHRASCSLTETGSRSRTAISVRYALREGKDALVFKTRHQTWHLNREDFSKSEWRRVKVSGSRADVIILDDIATESEVFTLEAPALTSHEPFTPPRAGSKGYQRRRNQRWPKGR
jgi:hypothetical protein